MTEGRRQFRLRTLLGVTALFAIAFSLVAANLPSYVSRDRIRGVRLGMTKAQVLDVMGPPQSMSLVGQDGSYRLFWNVWTDETRTLKQAGYIKDQAVVGFSSVGLVDEARTY